jgi:hypothetical protein
MEIISELGFSKDQSSEFITLAENTDIVEYVKAEARENDDIATRSRVLDLAAYQKRQETEFDEQDTLLDLRGKVYKDFMKIIDLTARFEINDGNMNALRNNFDSVLTVEDHIEYINESINKLNLLKTEIWRAKKYDRKYK